MNEFTDNIEDGSKSKKKEFDAQTAAREIGISVEDLLSWEKEGLFKSKRHGVYTKKDVMKALLAKMLMETRLYTFEEVIERIEQLE